MVTLCMQHVMFVASVTINPMYPMCAGPNQYQGKLFIQSKVITQFGPGAGAVGGKTYTYNANYTASEFV